MKRGSTWTHRCNWSSSLTFAFWKAVSTSHRQVSCPEDTGSVEKTVSTKITVENNISKDAAVVSTVDPQASLIYDATHIHTLK